MLYQCQDYGSLSDNPDTVTYIKCGSGEMFYLTESDYKGATERGHQMQKMWQDNQYRGMQA